MVCLRIPTQVWVTGWIEKSPLWVTSVCVCWAADVTGEPILGCAVAHELLLCLVKTDAVRASGHERVTKLDLIILPETNRADSVAARRLIEDQVAADWTRIYGGIAHARWKWPNDPATRRAGGDDCNRDAPAGLDAG